jgi:hypothetical protein
MEQIKLVLPNIHIETFGAPTIFLAGPIRGGGDWQKDAINMIYKRMPETYIFCPCRYGTNHELYSSSITQWMEQSEQGYYRKGTFPSQTMWERRYMSEAARDGSIIFWLAAESKEDPRSDGCYARETRRELGEWVTRLQLSRENLTWNIPKPHVVFGAEDGFPGLKQIVTNCEAQIPGMCFHESLVDTVEAALSFASIGK